MGDEKDKPVPGAATPGGRNEEGHRPVSTTEGTGPLLERDYYGVIDGGQLGPEEILGLLLWEFPRFSPTNLAEFEFKARSGPGGSLALGDEMRVRITGHGWTGVRVVDVTDTVLTLRTLEGHPETGRISFGACRNEAGELVFHIRSRSRISDPIRLVGYWLVFKKMQTEIWSTFVERVAEACGGRIRGEVRVEEREVKDRTGDTGEVEEPTFVAGREPVVKG